jgi:hypothetical protein
MPSPIIGSSGSYNNPRGNPRHGRTSAGQNFKNFQAAVGNAYLLEDIAAGDEGEVRFVDPATNEIDMVMTPIVARNISQRDYAKSSIMSYFRLPGITPPLLLVGDENDPEVLNVGHDPVGEALIDTNFGYIDGLSEAGSTVHFTDTGTPLAISRVSFSDPDPGGDDSGLYEVTLFFAAGIDGPLQELVIDVGDSDVTDETSPLPPANIPTISGTLGALNEFFAGDTTGSITGTVLPNRLYTLHIGITAPDGRSSSDTYYLVTFEKSPTLINSTTTIWVADDGNNVTGDGSEGNPYATVTKALSTLDDVVIAPDVFVNIIIKDGTITQTASIIVNHPNGDRISIAGQNTYSKSMTSVQSSSGSAGAWSVIVNLNNVTNIEVGDYVIILTATGGTRPTYIAGCHEVTNVDSVNSRITLASKHLAATAPSGAVTATVTVIKSVIKFAGGLHGISVANNASIGSVSKVAIVGAGTAFRYGADLFSGGSFRSGGSLGFSNWYAGVSVGASALFSGSFASSFSNYGAWLFDHGVIYAFSGYVISGCSVGVGCYRSSAAQVEFGLITGCTTGAESTVDATLSLFGATLTGNTSLGVFAANHAYVNIESASVEAATNGATNIPVNLISSDGSYIHSTTNVDKEMKLASDFTVTNASEQVVTGMTFPVVAGEQWIVEVEGSASGNNTTGDAAVNLMNTGTWVAARSNYDGIRYNGSGTLTTDAATAFSSTTRLAATTGLVCANGDGSIYPFRFVSQFDVSGSGTVQLVFGNSSASAGRSSTLYAGCRMSARRIKG